MIGLLAAVTAAAAALLEPEEVLGRYEAALAALHEPRVFAVEYTLVQTGARNLEQTHRIFRRGGDERDETIAINGTRTLAPAIRIFRGRPYRYTASAIAPRLSQYTFRYVGPARNGKHSDYVFRLTPKTQQAPFTRTEVAIDGLTFLPARIDFTSGLHHGSGSVTFTKVQKWWVASSARASARLPGGGDARERLTFSRWRFPASLPPSTFAAARPLPSSPPVLAP